ncbi:class I SAM-dependent methyltransferase [Arthrobacter koreensis]|uniref:class I SAM-dependent methyltransferase n=1 Tax=Arthrobacter koreensis TaxID=199136 RepID=UPI002DB90A51|nr:methyltransferase domain-containing protein [Arthrobacter koreensis]MEB7505687.1 methyltransferase domain-containing protein [Arthrobacter koreensis]
MPEQQPLAEIFDSGAGDFERMAPSLWNPMGNALVAAADVKLDENVLDACCGGGSITVPAAQSAGPGAVVDAVDLSAELLEVAAAKAKTLSLENVVFTQSDVLGFHPGTEYDVVLCGYAVFFLPDMDSGVRHLASLLRSGGRFAFSTWAEGALTEFSTTLFRHCAAEGVELPATSESSRDNMLRINTPQKATDWLQELGFSDVNAVHTAVPVLLSQDLAWSLVMGSPLRLLLPSDAAAADRVRAAFLAELGEEYTLKADTLIVTAVKP